MQRILCRWVVVVLVLSCSGHAVAFQKFQFDGTSVMNPDTGDGWPSDSYLNLFYTDMNVMPQDSHIHSSQYDHFDHNSLLVGNRKIDGAVLTQNSNENTSNPIPEPTTLLLFGTGILGLVGIGKRIYPDSLKFGETHPQNAYINLRLDQCEYFEEKDWVLPARAKKAKRHSQRP